MGSAPTLEDVAKQAGVSTATVSRCLNDPDRVVKKTRERVMQAVRDLGYSPNFGARAMAARRTNTMGAVIPTMENAFFARGLQAFQEELHANGYHLLVASSSFDPKIEDEQIRALVARGAEGLLLIGHDRLPETTAFLKQRGLPVMVSWACKNGADWPAVGFDNRMAMRGLTEAVLDLGHRRFAMIAAITDGNDRARARRDGVRDAVAAAGLDADQMPIVETRYSADEGAKAFVTLMHSKPRPTIVMCGSDVLAAGAVRAAREMGLRVPQDVSITGFDDIDLATLIDPPLTTVHVPHRTMGRQAAQELLRLRDGADHLDQQALPTRILVRGTLGPAPNC